MSFGNPTNKTKLQELDYSVSILSVIQHLFLAGAPARGGGTIRRADKGVGPEAASEPEVADAELAAVLADEAVVLTILVLPVQVLLLFFLLLNGPQRALPPARARAHTSPTAARSPPHLRRPMNWQRRRK